MLAITFGNQFQNNSHGNNVLISYLTRPLKIFINLQKPIHTYKYIYILRYIFIIMYYESLKSYKIIKTVKERN